MPDRIKGLPLESAHTETLSFQLQTPEALYPWPLVKNLCSTPLKIIASNIAHASKRLSSACHHSWDRGETKRRPHPVFRQSAGSEFPKEWGTLPEFEGRRNYPGTMKSPRVLGPAPCPSLSGEGYLETWAPWSDGIPLHPEWKWPRGTFSHHR